MKLKAEMGHWSSIGSMARPESSPCVMLAVVLCAALATLAVVAIAAVVRWATCANCGVM